MRVHGTTHERPIDRFVAEAPGRCSPRPASRRALPANRSSHTAGADVATTAILAGKFRWRSLPEHWAESRRACAAEHAVNARPESHRARLWRALHHGLQRSSSEGAFAETHRAQSDGRLSKHGGV